MGAFWKTRQGREKARRAAIVATASGLYVGYFPVASGTAGSLLGVGLVWLWRDVPWPMQCIIAAALTVGASWICQHAGIYFKNADSGRMVLDEIVGMLVTMIGMPVNAYWLGAGFLVFRFLDIVKFPPARYIDRHVKNGWGVVLDDVVAGVYGNIWLHLMLRATEF